MNKFAVNLLIVLVVSALGAAPRTKSVVQPTSASAGKGQIDFARDIQPIFTERCHSCHGPEKQKNGLRLDRKADALHGGDSGPALVPGDSAHSRLYQFIAGLDPDKVMPPKGERLTTNQVALIKKWIDAGAPWPDNAQLSTLNSQPSTGKHWSLKPPIRVDPPKVKNRKWIRNPIDNFVLARLEKERIEPSPEADRPTLIRRLSLDLTGLPPTPAEVAAFVTDKGKDAYERLVDRLLSSDHYGEQWARHWLDLARYADTDGYEKDFYRPHAWRWRDWVIGSINRDQPFDEFTRDQIAGDLLPSATIEQRVATGFHRNTLLNREGGVDIEEDRCKIVVDRVSTIGTTWLGLTVGCAECHSHKYDPIAQREFYQLYAFFNSTDDRDIKAPLSTESGPWRRKLTELDLAKQKYVEAPDPELDAWAGRVASLPDIWFTPQVEDYDLPTFGANNGANLYPQEDGSFLVTGMIESKTHYIMMLNTKLKGITGIRVEAMTDEMLPKLGPGWANGNFVLTELYVETASRKNVSDLKSNAVERAFADYSQAGFPISAAIDGIHTNGGWAVDMPGLAMHGVDRCAVFATKESLGYPDADMRLKVSLVQHEGRSHTLGRFRVTYTTGDRKTLADQTVPQRIRDIARIPPSTRTLDQKVALKRYYQCTFRTDAPDLIAYTKSMAKSPGLKGEVQAQTLAERQTPRPTHIHVRGNFLDHGAEVQAGTLSVLHALKPRSKASPIPSTSRPTAAAAAKQNGDHTVTDAPNPLGADGSGVSGSNRPDRLDLANWLTDAANPLTARVTANRIWAHLFGEGLVTTLADFGTQGERPSHPELLDWLATEFVRQKWSRKAMIKLIVTSGTYRQSSNMRSELTDRDARNRLLARQNRFRLPAENARDQYLAASGLLDETIGGASVKPESKRRGMYLQIKRAQIDYLLTTFDAPNTTQTCPKRERSNTPLQALTLLNDKVFTQCARALGQRAVKEHQNDTLAGIRYVFQLCLARQPASEDLHDLVDLFNRVRGTYAADSELAKKIAVEFQMENLPVAEAAAWTVLARTILNLDELITRE